MGVRKKIDTILSKCLIVLMGVMVINVLWQVASRFLLGSPSSFTDELARYLMIWIGILGAAYVSGRNMHVAIDVLPSKLNRRSQHLLMQFIRILIIFFALIAMLIGGARLVFITYTLGQHSPALQVPLSLVYLVIPISGIFIIYYKISDIIRK